MVEPVSVIAAGYVTKKVSSGLARLLGPSADEMAETLRRFTAKKLENVGRVVENANAKTADDGAEGSIPDRVAFRVLDEGSYSDDQFVVEYLGGVLASSRTPFGRDDRGNTLTAMVARMSTYHLRMHYILYTAAQRLLHGRVLNLGIANLVNQEARIWTPFEVYFNAMEFGEGEDWAEILSNSLFALEREGLAKFDASGDVATLHAIDAKIPAPGIVFRPSVPGIELFMWAAGKGQGTPTRSSFLDDEPFEIEGVHVADGSMLVHEIASPMVAQP